MRFVALLLSAIVVTGFSVVPVEAQVMPSVDELEVVLSPQYPRPYDTVTATLNSNLLDLAASTITFTANGTVVGENERSAIFKVGAPGTKTTLQVTVKDLTGTHQAQVVIVPAEVALVLEANSTVPPLYKGARLVASEGGIRLIAIPNFKTAGGAVVAPQNLSYTWKFGDKILQSDSGIGKNILTAQAPVRYRDAQISVTVTSPDKALVAQASTLVSPVDPVIQIYRSDPLEGIDFARALTNVFTLTSDEETFHAVPYYYSALPSVVWTLNGSETGSDPDLTVRTTGSSKGSAIVGVSTNDPDTLNNADARITIQFGESRSTGIFGL